ncbi:hypothetical protein [Sorangium sp. So ce854]|uniref:hypothetical protein n=1 Tax=Sorangium sp. So ce854 TaxID=3133322 RepID=UPI003F648ADB
MFPIEAAAADPTPLDREVQELIDEAEKAAKRLDLARARELWARVNVLKPSTMAVCQLGVFDLGLDRLEEAAAELETCVEQMPAPTNDIERRRYEVRHAALAAVRQRVAELHISPPPGTARLLVDGREVSAGGPVFVTPGQHEVTAIGKQGQVAHTLVKVASSKPVPWLRLGSARRRRSARRRDGRLCRLAAEGRDPPARRRRGGQARMVAVGDVWEGHELLSEERGMVRHFLARQVGDTRALVWLHLREGARLDEGVFTEEIARLRRLADEVPEVVPVLYGGVSGSVAWAASPVLGDAVPLLDAARESELGPDALQVLIDVGRCLVRAHELSLIHGALSPDRVFVVGDGRCAIAHLGFVRLFQLGPEQARHDPYGYAPPELLSGGSAGTSRGRLRLRHAHVRALVQARPLAVEHAAELSERVSSAA